jgi:PBP1b-binding outer membrane lipoprotein LpoB
MEKTKFKKEKIVLAIAVLAIFLVSGCVGGAKPQESLVDADQVKLSDLEANLKLKNAEVTSALESVRQVALSLNILTIERASNANKALIEKLNAYDSLLHEEQKLIAEMKQKNPSEEKLARLEKMEQRNDRYLVADSSLKSGTANYDKVLQFSSNYIDAAAALEDFTKSITLTLSGFDKNDFTQINKKLAESQASLHNAQDKIDSASKILDFKFNQDFAKALAYYNESVTHIASAAKARSNDPPEVVWQLNLANRKLDLAIEVLPTSSATEREMAAWYNENIDAYFRNANDNIKKGNEIATTI